jgi:hypothetical protein
MKTQPTSTLSMMLAASACAVGLAASTPALAAFGPAEVEARFKAADQDGNGKLTREEAKDGMPRIAKKFDELDTGKLGYLTLDQVQAAAAR